MEEEASRLAFEANGYVMASAKAVALTSIAISMKRVADEVCGVPYDQTPGADNSRHRMGLTDGITHAIEQGIIEWGNHR